MKKFTVILIGIFVLLTGCSSSESSTKDPDKQSDSALKIKSGYYVISKGETPEKDKGKLALEISLKNKKDKKIDFSSSDICLYDDEENKIEPIDFYSGDEDYKTLVSTKLSAGKSTSGFLTFQVDKNKKYDLCYEPSDEEKDTKVKVTASKYPDHSEKIKELTNSYVEQVFLRKSKNEKKKSLKIGNDIHKEATDYKQFFMDQQKQALEHYEPSSSEMEKYVDSFISANQKMTQVEYKVDELTPNRAVIYMKPKTLQVIKVDTRDISKRYIDQYQGQYSGDNNELSKDIEKYILQEVPAKFDETEPILPPLMKNEGLKLILNKKDKKWYMDTEDYPENDDFEKIKYIFMGQADV